jgi:hypothetical protein
MGQLKLVTEGYEYHVMKRRQKLEKKALARLRSVSSRMLELGCAPRDQSPMYLGSEP